VRSNSDSRRNLLSVDFVFQIQRVITADLNGVNAVFFLNKTLIVLASCSRCELGGSDSDKKIILKSGTDVDIRQTAKHGASDVSTLPME